MDQPLCDLCNSSMREGKYGEANWICTNDQCEKWNPQWPMVRLQRNVEPVYKEIEEVAIFAEGYIEINMQEWVGDGTFIVHYDDGREFECHVDGNEVSPDFPGLNEEIRSKIYQLITLRGKLEQAMRIV